jgi:hypothetical protein
MNMDYESTMKEEKKSVRTGALMFFSAQLLSGPFLIMEIGLRMRNARFLLTYYSPDLTDLGLSCVCAAFISAHLLSGQTRRIWGWFSSRPGAALFFCSPIEWPDKKDMRLTVCLRKRISVFPLTY